MKKKVRAIITVNLVVDEDLSVGEIKEFIGVGRYEECPSGEDVIHLKTDDFEVEDYVDITITDKEK